MAKYYGDGYIKEICQKIERLGNRHSTWQVFEDFLEMSAISLSNTVDWVHKEEREARYLETVKRYDKDEINIFPELFGNLVNALETEGRPSDVLGRVFHNLELHNKYHGQFFTPQHVSDMMAKISITEDNLGDVNEKGYISLAEPCCGSGVMIMSAAHVMIEHGFNHGEQMVVTATDIDLKCVYMCYLQCSLWGIPAVIIHGNTLLMQEWSRWYTPVYMLNGWLWRQRCGNEDKRYTDDEALKCATDPVYAAVRQIDSLDPKEKTAPAEDQVSHSPQYDIELKESRNGQMSLF